MRSNTAKQLPAPVHQRLSVPTVREDVGLVVAQLRDQMAHRGFGSDDIGSGVVLAALEHGLDVIRACDRRAEVARPCKCAALEVSGRHPGGKQDGHLDPFRLELEPERFSISDDRVLARRVGAEADAGREHARRSGEEDVGIAIRLAKRRQERRHGLGSARGR